jgi:hypothetical protein
MLTSDRHCSFEAHAIARAVPRRLSQSRVAMAPGTASRLPLVVRPSSERVRQDCSFAKKQESPPALLVARSRRGPRARAGSARCPRRTSSRTRRARSRGPLHRRAEVVGGVACAHPGRVEGAERGARGQQRREAVGRRAATTSAAPSAARPRAVARPVRRSARRERAEIGTTVAEEPITGSTSGRLVSDSLAVTVSASSAPAAAPEPPRPLMTYAPNSTRSVRRCSDAAFTRRSRAAPRRPSPTPRCPGGRVRARPTRGGGRRSRSSRPLAAPR